MDSGNIQLGKTTYKDRDGREREAVATWTGSLIVLGPAFFGRFVGGWAYNPAFHNLKTLDAQLLTILHELGHGTKAEGADHNVNGLPDHDKSVEFNEKIYQNCIANRN